MSCSRRIDTTLIHAGEAGHEYGGAVSMPVFQSSTFEFTGETDYHELRYIRLNNTPNHACLHTKLAALEGGESALVAASGMAAITTSLLTLLRTGDHVLALDCLYGGTREFIANDLPSLGIECDFLDGNDPASWERLRKPTTKAIYVEAMTNPLLQVPDLEAVVAFARSYGLVSMIDNTFATPINFRPIAMGFDLVLHSCTKYLNGHTDIVAGAVIGKLEMVTRIRHKMNHLGGALDPHACFLLNRGLKTLALRVRHQNTSALRIAEYLESNDAVGRVHYPGLASNAGHERARRWFDGFGGMLSFEPAGGVEAAERFIENVSIPRKAPSLGGVESLITQPARTSHVCVPAAERERMGIGDNLIRLSVGIEDTDDLLEDFEHAFAGQPAKACPAVSQA